MTQLLKPAINREAHSSEDPAKSKINKSLNQEQKKGDLAMVKTPSEWQNANPLNHKLSHGNTLHYLSLGVVLQLMEYLDKTTV